MENAIRLKNITRPKKQEPKFFERLKNCTAQCYEQKTQFRQKSYNFSVLKVLNLGPEHTPKAASQLTAVLSKFLKRSKFISNTKPFFRPTTNLRCA